jgi:hypothetical protein
LASVLVQSGDSVQAEFQLQRVLALRPQNAETLHSQGMLQAADKLILKHIGTCSFIGVRHELRSVEWQDLLPSER